MKKLTKEEIIERLKNSNPNYEYNKVEYVNIRTPVIITCPAHGDFSVKIETFCRYGVCPQCSKKRTVDKREWLEKAIEVHNNKYTYNFESYKLTKDKVEIYCPEHNLYFYQNYEHHIKRKQGCPKCNQKLIEENIKNMTKSTELFIEQVSKIHNGFYNYDKVEYTRAHDKVIITCPIHGDFEQTAYAHFNGQGCPHCSKSKGEEKIASLLTESNISFLREYSFKDLYDKSPLHPLKFDFYIPSRNLLVEYDGDQHYRFPNPYHKTIDDFLDSCYKDDLKNKYCLDNNLKLVRIRDGKIENLKKLIL